MEKAKHSIRFESRIDNRGRVNLSKHVDALQLPSGSAVTVKIFGGSLSKRLTTLGVTDEEIEQIGERQLEDREHVVSFLSSQGVLRGTRFGKRTVRT
ncbi:MAG: hypothetical protein ACYC09_08635 [Bacteroidota bacterium]